MPILFNVYDEDVRALSGEAGAEIASALGLLMRCIESTERGIGLDVDMMIPAVPHLRLARERFRELQTRVQTTNISLPQQLRPAWDAARRFVTATQLVVNRELPELPPRKKITAQIMMKFAADLSESLAVAIERTTRASPDEARLRHVSMQASILQISGALVAESFARLSKPISKAA